MLACNDTVTQDRVVEKDTATCDTCDETCCLAEARFLKV